MLKTRCGKCGASYQYDEPDVGSAITCDCGEKVSLPPKPVKAKPESVKPLVEDAKPAAVPEPKSRMCPGCGKPTGIASWDLLAGMCTECAEESRAAAKAKRRAEAEAVKQGIALPTFGMLATLAGILRVVGILAMVLGTIALLLGIFRLVEERGTSGGSAAELMWAGGGLLFSGLIQAAAGEALECLRVMTVNSFHIRNEIKGMNAKG